MKAPAWLLFVLLLATSCSTPRTAPVVRFHEQDQANLVVRYYTDDTSYVLKPPQRDGAFLRILKLDEVLEVAKQQPGRQLAVVILIHNPAPGEDAKVQLRWRNLLRDLGYQRVVFLRAKGGMKVNGLPVMAGDSPVAASAG